MAARIFLSSINKYYIYSKGEREESNKYNLKMAISRIFENIPQTILPPTWCVGTLGQTPAIPHLHPAGMASSLERPQIFLL